MLLPAHFCNAPASAVVVNGEARAAPPAAVRPPHRGGLRAPGGHRRREEDGRRVRAQEGGFLRQSHQLRRQAHVGRLPRLQR